MLDLAHALVKDATHTRATDIHLDPRTSAYAIRVRIDGEMHPASEVDRAIGEALVRAIQVAAQIDPATSAERREGRAQLGPEKASIRVGSATTVQGEKLTLRLLDAALTQRDIPGLGLGEAGETLLRDWTESAEGMVLVAGPTGSGKTTTAYALLQALQSTGQTIITLEDPVEIIMDGLTQIQLDEDNPAAPSSFEEGITDVLRHDPDAIFLGEIRDEATTRAAVDASFSGHVLISTMHARDPAGAVTLLRSMGAKDYEIAAALRLVVGQRIVRRLCSDCGEVGEPHAAEAAWLNELGRHSGTFGLARGCDACSGTGYRRLTALFELWHLGERDYEAILAHEDENRLRASLRESGVTSLLESALEKAASGEISLREARHLHLPMDPVFVGT